MNAKSMTMLAAALAALGAFSATDAGAVDVTGPVIEGCAQLPRDRCSRGSGLLSSKPEGAGKDSRVAKLASVSGSLSGLGLGGFSVAEETPPVETEPVAAASPQANTGGEDDHTRKPSDRANGKVRFAQNPQANTGNGGRASAGRDEQGNELGDKPARRGKGTIVQASLR